MHVLFLRNLGPSKLRSKLAFMFGHTAAGSCLNYSIISVRDMKTPCIMDGLHLALFMVLEVA